MRRGRKVSLLAMLLALAAASYWMTHRDGPSPVLRTIAIGASIGNSTFDAGYGRFYVNTNSRGVMMIDTRHGELLQPTFLTQLLSPPVPDPRSGHLFDHDLNSQAVLLDERTGALLRHVDLPDRQISGLYLDSPDERVYLNYGDSATVTVVDLRRGTVLRNVASCSSSAAVAASATAERFFEPCDDGTTAVFDARSGRQLRTLNTAGLGPAHCWPVSDERADRVLLLTDKALGLLDARTGALVRTLPVRVCPVGGVELDPRTGDVLVAPYVSEASGPPAREVLVLDGRTGAVRHRWAVPENPTDVQVNPLTGHLLVTSAGPVDRIGEPLGDGSLSVLDPERGITLRRIELGILPGTQILDPSSRHLFVVNFATALDGSALTRSYPDGTWPQLMRSLKSHAGWLPFAAPAAPSPPTGSTVTMLDLSKL